MCLPPAYTHTYADPSQCYSHICIADQHPHTCPGNTHTNSTYADVNAHSDADANESALW